jgi:nickel transport protein
MKGWKLSNVLLVILIVILLASPVLLAHRIVAYSYIADGSVIVESSFGDGSPIKDGEVKVHSSQGELLKQGTTDGAGIYKFKAKQAADLKIIVTDKLGHQAESMITKEDFPANFNESKDQKKASDLEAQNYISKEKVEAIIKTEVARQLKPIRQEMKQLNQRSQPGIFEIIAGLGYIFGLMGVIYYFKARRDQSS